MRTSRLAVVIGLLWTSAISCSSPTAPDASVRGVGFYYPISAQALSQLERLGTVLTVVRSARVVLIASGASSAALGAVHGAVEVGPPLGSAHSVQLEAALRFAAEPTQEQLTMMTAIGAITGENQQAHVFILLVPLENLARLDTLPGALDVAVFIDHSIPR